MDRHPAQPHHGPDSPAAGVGRNEAGHLHLRISRDTCLGSALAFGRWRIVEFEAAERLLAHFMGFLKRWVAV